MIQSMAMHNNAGALWMETEFSTYLQAKGIIIDLMMIHIHV